MCHSRPLRGAQSRLASQLMTTAALGSLLCVIGNIISVCDADSGPDDSVLARLEARVAKAQRLVSFCVFTPRHRQHSHYTDTHTFLFCLGGGISVKSSGCCLYARGYQRLLVLLL